MDNQNGTPIKQSKKQTSNGPKSGRKNFTNTEAMNEARRRNLQLAREVRKNKPPRLFARSLSKKQYEARLKGLREFHFSDDPIFNAYVYDCLPYLRRAMGGKKNLEKALKGLSESMKG